MNRRFAIVFVLVDTFLAAATTASAASYTTADVAKHASPEDCWIVIEGKVYDVTKYLKKHPAPKSALEDTCGKDGTQGWKTKGSKNKAHSQKAALLLKTFEKGKLVDGQR